MMDLTYLESICEGDRAKMRDYIALYLEEAPPLFDRLREAGARQDHEALAATAHSLRSIVSIPGLTDLYAMLTDLERLAQARDAAVFALLKTTAERHATDVTALEEALAHLG